MVEKKNEESKLAEGIKLYKRNDFTNALAFFISLPENSDIDNIELAYYIGLCYARLERYDDALLYLEQVVTGDKENERMFQCRYLLAVIYAKIGKKRMADFELNKLLEKGYQPSKIYSSLAYVAWEQDETEKCISYYKKINLKHYASGSLLIFKECSFNDNIFIHLFFVISNTIIVIPIPFLKPIRIFNMN